MADGLHNVAGADGEICLNGHFFRVNKLRLKHKAELEAHILSHRPNLVAEAAAALESLPEETRALYRGDVLDAALRQMSQRKSVSRDEYNAYCDTFDGVCYVVWQMVREHQPEMTHESVSLLCEGIEIEVLQDEVDRASGEAALKNSDGLTAASGQAKHGQHGQNSTDSSLPNMDGRLPPSMS